MVKPTLGTDELAFSALEQGSAIDAILPVMELIRLCFLELQFFNLAGFDAFIHDEIY